MSARSKARKRALDVLFECEVRGLPLGATLDERVVAAEPPVNEYTVAADPRHHRAPGPASTSWSRRTPRAGRSTGCPRSTATRCGSAIYEMLYVDDVPDAVAVSEAMTLVRDLSTDESPSFVNGVLGNIVRNKSALRLTAQDGRTSCWNAQRLPSGSANLHEPAPRQLVDAGALDAAAAQVVPRRVGVRDDDLDHLRRPVGHHVQAHAEADRARRAGRRHLHEAQPLVDDLVEVDVPADLAAVERRRRGRRR